MGDVSLKRTFVSCVAVLIFVLGCSSLAVAGAVDTGELAASDADVPTDFEAQFADPVDQEVNDFLNDQSGGIRDDYYDAMQVEVETARHSERLATAPKLAVPEPQQAEQAGEWISQQSPHFTFTYLSGHVYARDWNPDKTLADLESFYTHAVNVLGFDPKKRVVTGPDGRLEVRIETRPLSEVVPGATSDYRALFLPFGSGNSTVGWDGARVHIDGTINQYSANEGPAETEASWRHTTFHEVGHSFMLGYQRDLLDIPFFAEPAAEAAASEFLGMAKKSPYYIETPGQPLDCRLDGDVRGCVPARDNNEAKRLMLRMWPVYATLERRYPGVSARIWNDFEQRLPERAAVSQELTMSAARSGIRMPEWENHERAAQTAAMQALDSQIPGGLPKAFVEFANGNLTKSHPVWRRPQRTSGQDRVLIDTAKDSKSQLTVPVNHLASEYIYVFQSLPGIVENGVKTNDVSGLRQFDIPGQPPIVRSAITPIALAAAHRNVAITVDIPQGVYARPELRVGEQRRALTLNQAGTQATIVLPAMEVLSNPVQLALANGNLSGPAANFTLTVESR